MSIMHYVIAAMLLVQFSMFAQSTGQVTLSIKLYPIQIIEVEPTNNQVLEYTHPDLTNSSSSSQLSTYSTSQFILKVDSVNSSAFDEMRASSAVQQLNIKSTHRIINAERYDFEVDGDDLNVVYSMEAM